MIVKIQGTITSALQKRSGVSQMGNAWAIQEFVVTDAQNNSLCFEVFGEENIQKFSINQQVNVDCILNSREYNGRYYTSLRYLAPKVDANQMSVQQPMRQQVQGVPQQTTQIQQGYSQPMQPSVVQTHQQPMQTPANNDALPF